MQAIKNLDYFNQLGGEFLPGHLGIKVTKVGEMLLEAELDVRTALLAPNSYLHAGTIVTLADTACGYGCIANLKARAISPR
jgi:uncharacterized protein (TIGR00369 family)